MNAAFKQLIAIVLLSCIGFVVWIILKPVSPHLSFMKDGTVNVIGCFANVPQSNSNDCVSLYCEKALFEERIIPFGVSATRRFHRYEISNRKGISMHYIHFTDNGLSVFAMCEMKNATSVNLRKISEEEFNIVFEAR
jgi:hypothetical protein